MATPPDHQSDFDAFLQLEAPRRLVDDVPFRTAVGATRGPTPSRLMNVDHSVLR
ncbi:MAG TPA: hypothetical protein VGF11_01985 [Acidimicrobiales bacterium]